MLLSFLTTPTCLACSIFGMKLKFRGISVRVAPYVYGSWGWNNMFMCEAIIVIPLIWLDAGFSTIYMFNWHHSYPQIVEMYISAHWLILWRGCSSIQLRTWHRWYSQVRKMGEVCGHMTHVTYNKLVARRVWLEAFRSPDLPKKRQVQASLRVGFHKHHQYVGSKKK
jgi:hypothetical protein